MNIKIVQAFFKKCIKSSRYMSESSY